MAQRVRGDRAMHSYTGFVKVQSTYLLRHTVLGATLALTGALAGMFPASSFARDVEYENSEIAVYVTPGEPTQVQLPGPVSGGVKKKLSSLSLEHKAEELVIFASEAITDGGEAIIVRLTDGRSYALRVKRASGDKARDDVIKIDDPRGAVMADASEEPVYKERTFDYAQPTQVSGLMREMVLNSEFGKKAIPGYRVSESHKGEVVLSDGTIEAKIDRIFMGPTLWGYVLDTTNLLDTTQKMNPASFRIDGTRAISMERWELSPRPLTIEQQIAQKHQGKVYVITRPQKAE